MNEKQAKLLLDRYRNVIVPHLFEEIRAIKTLPTDEGTIEYAFLCDYIDDLLEQYHENFNLADSDVEVKPSMVERMSTWAYKSAKGLVKSLVDDRVAKRETPTRLAMWRKNEI
tara:strand:- start:819 stop:1157 length:339 start_codon:yes stop_codon:yes gene_type:complete